MSETVLSFILAAGIGAFLAGCCTSDVSREQNTRFSFCDGRRDDRKNGNDLNLGHMVALWDFLRQEPESMATRQAPPSVYEAAAPVHVTFP